MTETNPRSFLPLKPHWFHIMLSLASGEQHGYAIMQEVLDRTTGKVACGLRRSTVRSSA